MEIFWTEERTTTAVSHHDQGLSASQSAAVLGTTRNAVIGKWGRLKLPPRRAVPPPKAASALRIRKGRSTIAFVGQSPRNTPQPEPYQSTQSADDIPRQQRKTMATLGERHCRFPYGDPHKPDFFFCGAARKDADTPIDRGGFPYCITHHQLAYGGYGRSLEGFKPS